MSLIFSTITILIVILVDQRLADSLDERDKLVRRQKLLRKKEDLWKSETERWLIDNYLQIRRMAPDDEKRINYERTKNLLRAQQDKVKSALEARVKNPSLVFIVNAAFCNPSLRPRQRRLTKFKNLSKVFQVTSAVNEIPLLLYTAINSKISQHPCIL